MGRTVRSSAVLLAVAFWLGGCARQSTPPRPTVLWFGGDVHFGERGRAALEGLALGAVERRGATVIAWGLGNLAFDCECTNEDEGLLVRLELQGRNVTRATAVPVRAGLHGEHARMLDDATTNLSLLESLGSVLTNKTSTRADW